MNAIKKNLIYLILFFTFSVFLYINYRYLDIEFLAYTNGDEFMQFHSLYRMFEGFREFNLENIFRFDSYVYGFIWHLINLLFTLPFHLLGNTEMAIFMPRVVNAIFSVGCLFVIFLISRIFLNYFYSYGIVLFTLSMSGFFKSGYLFKPDVFQALLILISTYFLIKDNFAFKKYFYFGVLFFALSIGAAKIQAIMFIPLIYLYIGSKFIFKANLKNLLFAIKNGFFSTLAIIAIFVITNPYLLNKRGFNAWFNMFTMNMDSNITNHGSYVNVTIMDKLFKVIDFYYIEIINFIILIAFCIYFLISIFRFKPLNTNNLRVFFVPLCASLISIIYLFLFVNKTWMNYYVSSIYLLVLILIPLFVLHGSKKLVFIILAFQIGGGYKQFSICKSI